MQKNLNDATNLLLSNGSKVLESETILLNGVNKLLNPNPSLHTDSLLLFIHLEDLVHERQIHHPRARQTDPIGGKTGSNGSDPVLLLMSFLDESFEISESLRLVKVPGLDLVSTTPVRDGVEIFGERGVSEDLSLLVFGVLGEGEGEVSCGAGEESECCVSGVFTELLF